jgi:hypothetical protein
MTYITQFIFCDRCGAELEHVLARKVCADGRFHFGWLCLECGGFTTTVLRGKPRKWIGKFEAIYLCVKNGIKTDQLPTVGEPDRTPCRKCGHTGGVQAHHVMPQGLFDDADTFGTMPLCVKCHADVHRKLDVAKIKKVVCN